MCRYVSVIGVSCYRSARGGFEDVVGKEGRLGKEFRRSLFIPKTSQLYSRLIHSHLFIPWMIRYCCSISSINFGLLLFM
jgi:hypothetical protein